MNPTEIIQELNSMSLPESVQLSEWEVVVDVRLCINTNVQLMEQAGTHALQSPAWERLQRLYAVLTAE